MNIQETLKKMKEVSTYFASSSIKQRNQALLSIYQALDENKEKIFEANEKDLKEARENNISESIIKRLKFDVHKLQDVREGIKQLIELEDPIHHTLLERELDEGLVLKRISVPLGVVGVIFEARPDALVQISSLCIKSGNCAVLKGGKETKYTNECLFHIIHESFVSCGLPEYALALLVTHEDIDALLTCDKEVDLLIPRGSNKFVQYIMSHTKIPVMGHADGVCHIYVDEINDLEKQLRLIVDAKTQYSAACNAMETLLVKRSIASSFLPELKKVCDEKGITLNGTKEVNDIIDVHVTEDFHHEYLDFIFTIKLVENVQEAVKHINEYGSHHTDAILTENKENQAIFTSLVDSAGVYVNASTRFADGFRYGFGAEVGISTSKIHARGPVGLDGLVTYKYVLVGHHQIVGDYASGKSQFHFKDIK